MITDRQKKLINSIIETYVETAEPVSSKFIGQEYFPGLSSATIRNEMHSLEELGLLTQLHTSGGRVPTDRAYRFYVDELFSTKKFEPAKTVRNKVKETIDATEPESRSINKAIAQLVAELSDNLAIANTLEENDFFKVGLASLFGSPEFKEINSIFRITDVFEHFDRMFAQFEREIFGEFFNTPNHGIKVVIGRENPVQNVQNETVIFAKYQLPRQQFGSLTVIGPTRMNYEKNLGLIQCVIEEINNKSNNGTKTKKT